MKRLIDLFLSIPAHWALVAIFFLTASEAALFFGFVIPGEIAAVLGGVLASFGRISLMGALAAAILGAIVGDSIGFQIGKRYGSGWLERRFPRKWGAVSQWLARHGPVAVFFGRYSAFLRAAVPTAAGAARLRYAPFLLWNVLGGVTWATGFTLLGYLAGEGYEAALRWAHRGSVAALLVIGALVGIFALLRLVRRRRALRAARELLAEQGVAPRQSNSGGRL